MTQKILGPEGSKRRKRFWLVPMLVTMLAAVFWVTGAQAVHDLDFQLDGDVIASTTTSISGTEEIDWDSLINADGSTKASLPPGFENAKLSKDFVGEGPAFVTTDTTTFATGSKDTLPISGWQCNFDNNVNSKIDVMNAYAAAYTDPGTGDEVLYFGLERNTNTGDANVAFWFLQDAVGCETDGASETFVGEHKDGDLLIVSAFSKGGDVSTIDVYRWDRFTGTCLPAPAADCVINPVGVPGSLNTGPVASGVDCRDPDVTAGDLACAVANEGTITTPWLTANFKDKVGHQLLVGEFFEGGLNLTEANLGGKCFNVFIGDTRSSTSLTSTLFDFAQGVIGQCTSTTVTTPSITSGTIPADPADASVSVTDSALVTVEGIDDWSGAVTFHLCGPTAAASTDLCASGGVEVAAAGTGIATDEVPTVVSAATIVTSAGRYCWRAEFAGDAAAGLPGSSDSRANECFVIAPRQPTLVTQATIGPVDFGQKISDTVTLANTAHKPGSGGPTGSNGTINPTSLGGDATGDITLTAFGPDSCSTVAHGPVTIAASGNGSYGGVGTAFEFTPAAPGEYVFVASYAGDLPNTLGVAAIACASQPSNERVVVRQIPTTISTTQKAYPQDSATVTSTVAGNNLPAGGTVIFRLYGPTTGPAQTALQNCLASTDAADTVGLLYKQTVTTGAAANSQTVETTNTTVAVSTNTTFYWRVTYATGDTAHTGRQSDCVENLTTAFVNEAGPGTLFP